MLVEEAQEVEISDEAPEDFAAYEAWRENGGGSSSGAKEPVDVTPPAGDKEPASELTQETEEGQTAVDPEAIEEVEQEAEEAEEAEAEPEEPAAGVPDKGLAKRMRQLTGEIKSLKSQLAELNQPEIVEEEQAEVVSAPVAAVAVDLGPRPKLSDFEDSDTLGTAWDQYEKARDERQALELQNAVNALRAEAASEKLALENQHVKAIAELAWSEAASRYPDYNQVVMNKGVTISPAMEAVMRMDPKSGTDIAYWLGQHPEESLRIAESTIHNNDKEWNTGLARAGMEFGMIRAKITGPGKGPVPVPAKAAAATAAAAAIPAPKPAIKTTTTAKRPPTMIRASAVAPKTDTMSDQDARDYNKWEAQREREIAAKNGKR